MREEGVPGVRGNKPKPMESKVRQLDDVGSTDKFMNYCGKPVASEVTFGQTGFVGLWSEDEGDSWPRCRLLEPWSPSKQRWTRNVEDPTGLCLAVISLDIPVAAHQ